MICPYCSNEMRKGYIQCRDGVSWTPKNQWVSALSSFAKDAVALGTDDKLMPNGTAIAYNCENCKRVIIPYGGEN